MMRCYKTNDVVVDYDIDEYEKLQEKEEEDEEK